MASGNHNRSRAGLIIALATGGGVPRRSFYTALIVGSILTGINQGDVILAGAEPNFLKIGLNYLVPYCVATYGAVTAKMAALRDAEREGPGRFPVP